MGLNHTLYPLMNVSTSYKVVFSLEKTKQKNSPFGNEFLSPSKNIILKTRPIIYPLKYKDICDYNNVCLMPSGLMLDYIIIHMISNEALGFHGEEVDFFTNIDNNIYICVQRVTSIILLKESH